CPDKCITCTIDINDEIVCTYTNNLIVKDGCIADYVWESTTKSCQACNQISPNLLILQDSCKKCTGLFFDGTCQSCLPTTIMDDFEKCDSCFDSLGGYAKHSFYDILSVCLEVVCDASSDPVVCNSCHGWYHDGNDCIAINCAAKPFHLSNSLHCNSCDNRIMHLGLCRIGNTCTGIVNDSINLYCYARWDQFNGSCQAVDCADETRLIGPVMCGACHNRYYYQGACHKIDCIADPLNTLEKCRGCRRMLYYWNGSCIQTTCTVTLYTQSEECYACEGYYWNGSQCLAIACSGIMTNDQNKCTKCFGKTQLNGHWVATQCTSSLNQNDCSFCKPFMYFDSNQNTCKRFTRTIPTNKEICDQAMDYYWNGMQCIGFTPNCTRDYIRHSAYTQEMCTGCINAYFDPMAQNICHELDCSNLYDIASVEKKCKKCQITKQGLVWENLSCTHVDCSQPNLLDSIHCLACPLTKFENGICYAIPALTCLTEAKSLDTCNACKPANSLTTTQWYESYGGACEFCVENCKVCDDTGCSQCIDGYYLNGGCIDCQSVSPPTLKLCALCKGRFWSGDSCKNCMDKCEECTNLTSCSKCEIDSIWNNNMCEACLVHTQQSCEDCSNDQNTLVFINSHCEYCYTEIILDTQNLCERCGLITTNNVNSKFWDISTMQCLNCPINCAKCDKANTCNSCHNDYYFNNATFQCEACPLNCDVCISTSSCVSCKYNFFYDDINNGCVACLNNCISCNDIESCIECEQYMFFDKKNNKCQKCPQFCAICDELNTCIECNYNMYWDSEMTLCRDCIPDCSICSTNSICEKCVAGYFFENETKKCTSCKSNCFECTNKTECVSCYSGYCVDEKNDCIFTTKNCHSCKYDSISQSQSCTSCVQGYNLEFCLECSSFCVKCLDNTQCVECRIGTYLENSLCKKCPNNCKDCFSNLECNECSEMFYFNNVSNECEACPKNCLSCQSENNCEQCIKSNQFFNGINACDDCIINCQKCYSTDECDVCMPGYIINTDRTICLECPANCEECQSGGVCIKCDEYSYREIDNNQHDCKKCSGIIDYCNKCMLRNEQLICIECAQGSCLSDNDLYCIKSSSNCLQCIDPKTECLKCENTYHLTEDKIQCTSNRCYTCSTKECDYEDTNNMIGCPDLGLSNSCWISHTQINNKNYYSRACKNVTCDDQSLQILCKTTDSTGN
ncbi:hypothetical protein A3Q56_04891, partial [Intoshia linei]